MTAAIASRNVRLIVNRDVANGILLATALSGLSYLAALALGWIETINWLEAFAVFTSYACTYLCVKQRRFNYPIGALSTTAYCVLFYQEGLYASMALNAYLTPILIYGWIRWRADAVTRPVTRVEVRWIPVYAIVTAAAFAGAVLLASALGARFAAADSVILVGSILAQFLLDNKKVETWGVWIVVNVVAIWEYTSAGLPLAGLQYVFFLGNAIWAITAWRRTMTGVLA